MTQTDTEQQEAPPVEQETPTVDASLAAEFKRLVDKARSKDRQRMTSTDLDLAKRMALMYGRGPKKRDPYPEESEYYIHCLRKYNLDPMQRQICAVWRWDKNAVRPDGVLGDEVMTVQTQIDGFRCIAARTGQYAGSDDPVFEYDDTGSIIKCTKTVWRIVKGVRCPFTQPAYWDEYIPPGDGAFMWKRMKHCMIAKCAEALALRTAFPADLGGLYVDAEMEQGNMTPPADAPGADPDAPTAPTRRERQESQEPPALDAKSVYLKWYVLAAQREKAGDAAFAGFDVQTPKAGEWRTAMFKTFAESILARTLSKDAPLTPDELAKIVADMTKYGDARPFDRREQA